MGFKVFRVQGLRISALGDLGTRYVERETCWLLWGWWGHDGPGENGFSFCWSKGQKEDRLRHSPPSNCP